MNDRDVPSILQWFLARGAAESSRATENIQHNWETQIRIPIGKAFTAGFIGLPLVLVGYIGVVYRVFPVVFGLPVMLMDSGLIGIALILVALVARSSLNSSKINPQVGNVLALLSSLVFLVVVSLSLASDRWTDGDLVVVVLSLSCVLSGTLLTFYMTNEMINPLWPPSPNLITMREWLAHYLDKPKVVGQREPIIIHSKGKAETEGLGQRILRLLKGEPESEPDYYEESAVSFEHEHWMVHPGLGNLLWFIELAVRQGSLARNQLEALLQPTPTLPFPELDPDGEYRPRELDRRMHNILIERATKRGWVIRERQRVAPRWTHSPEFALGQAYMIWEQLAPGHEFPHYREGMRDQTPTPSAEEIPLAIGDAASQQIGKQASNGG